MRTRMLALLIAALVATSCGSNDPNTESTQAADPPATSEPAPETPEVDPADADADARATVIAHKFGEAVIEAMPQRVVTIGYSEQDAVLALGVVPVAVREWFGGFDYAAWPWAQEALGSGMPEVLDMPYGELAYETIAGLAPDLIVATHAGITQEEYDILAAIAPTIAEPADIASFAMAWQDQTRMIGEALYRSDEAQQAVVVVEAAILDAARTNEDLGGASFAWANPTADGTYWVVGAGTPPMQFLQQLGLTYPATIAEVVGDADSFELSAEQISLLDVDVLILQADADTRAAIEADPLWQQTTVITDSRVLWLDASDPIYGALSFSTVLSIEYLVDNLVPELAELTTTSNASETEDPDAKAAAAAFAAVFNSEAQWEDKAAHLENAADLETTNDAYREAGDPLGGIELEPTNIVLDGETATVTYNVLFGGTETYSDLTRTITKIDGLWVVSEGDYCDFLASARTPCG